MIKIHLESVDSTNNYAKKLLSGGEQDGGIVVVCTDEQTSGRGQKGNSWESEKGKNLTFSIICHPKGVLASEQFIISQAIALSIADALKSIQVEMTKNVDSNIQRKFQSDGEDADASGLFCVKWPNDIYYGDRKISGTLIECNLSGKHVVDCIIGSGINVNQDVFLSDAPNPISLKQIYGKEFDVESIMVDVTVRFESYMKMIDDGDVDELRRRYMDSLYRKEGFHGYRNKYGDFMARIRSIEKSGHLVLETDGGEIRRYEFKEVGFKMKNEK